MKRLRSAGELLIMRISFGEKYTQLRLPKRSATLVIGAPPTTICFLPFELSFIAISPSPNRLL